MDDLESGTTTTGTRSDTEEMVGSDRLELDSSLLAKETEHASTWSLSLLDELDPEWGWIGTELDPE